MLMSTLKVVRQIQVVQEQLNGDGCMEDFKITYSSNYDVVSIMERGDPETFTGNDTTPEFQR